MGLVVEKEIKMIQYCQNCGNEIFVQVRMKGFDGFPWV